MVGIARRVFPLLLLAPLGLSAFGNAPASAAGTRLQGAGATATRAHRPPDSEAVVYTFQGGNDGSLPYAGLVADSQGALYGATLHGGTPSGTNGTVYKLTPNGSGGYVESVIWSFAGYPNDGQYPYGGLVIDKNGDLFGTTYHGGNAGQGVVFELTPSGSAYTESILYNFQGGVTDGADPYAGLYMDAKGALYGTTQYGGGPSGGFGTVFKLSRSHRTYVESIIHAFQGGNDGATPWAGLTGDAHGVLYGTTGNGGSPQNLGSVFKLAPSGSGYQETLLYNFPYPGGSHPFGGVILDGRGALYGTTTQGGPYNAGIVFELTPNGSSYTEQTLYTFDGCGFSSPTCDGAQPAANLFLRNWNLYGTTQYGGNQGVGTIFELTPRLRAGHCSVCAAAGLYTETLLHQFQGGSDGRNPEAGFVEQSGLLYSTTFYGGGLNDGTVFSVAL